MAGSGLGRKVRTYVLKMLLHFVNVTSVNILLYNVLIPSRRGDIICRTAVAIATVIGLSPIVGSKLSNRPQLND